MNPRRTIAFALLALSAASCDAFDQLLEAPAEPEGYINIGWPHFEVPVTQGQTHTLKVLVIRRPDYSGALSFAILGLPTGSSATVSTYTSANKDTVIATYSLKIDPTLPEAHYAFTLRVKGERLKDSDKKMRMLVSGPPTYKLRVAPQQVKVVRGGIAPVTVKLERDNFTDPVSLSLQTTSPISATFAPQPTTADSTRAVVSVDPNLAPGTYAVAIHGTPAAAGDSAATLSVVVVPEDLQVISDDSITSLQGRTVKRNVIVNARANVGAVTLSAVGLPSNATATFSAIASRESEMALAVSPQTPVGIHSIIVTASAVGIPDAVDTLALAVKPSGLTLNLLPSSVAVFQGAKASGRFAIDRVALDTTVVMSIENAPAGLTIAPLPASITLDNGGVIDMQASGSTAPGTYDVTVVATPAGWSTAMGARKVLSVTVRAAPAGTGNVILDWNGCASPAWVAVQDGIGTAWTRVTPVQNAARVTIASGRGGVAWTESDSVFAVRFLTTAEFSDYPEVMCPPTKPTGTISGDGLHLSASEIFRYGFGGGTATSTQATPQFTVTGVAPGTHDLVVWGTGIPETRGFIRRDLTIADGGSVGLIDLGGIESFAPQAMPLTVTNMGTDVFSYSMSYLTREACTPNLLYTITPLSTVTTALGIPTAQQLPRDRHLLTMNATASNRLRATTMTLQSLSALTYSMPATVVTPTVFVLGGSYRRLQMNAFNITGTYNLGALFEYTAGNRRVSILVSKGYVLNSTTVTAIMPDLSAVSGWQNSFAPPQGATGAWTATFNGGTSTTPCSTGYTANLLRYNGNH